MGLYRAGAPMVLRLALLLTMLFNLCSLAKAITHEQKINFKKSKQLYKDELYQQTIEMLSTQFDLNSPKTASGALTLAAYSYQKLEDYAASNKVYRTLINKGFKKLDEEMMKSYSEDGTDDLPEASHKLYFYYHKMAQNLLKIYLRDYKTLELKAREQMRARASMYVEILGEADDYEDDSYDEITEQFEKHDKFLVDSVYHSSWFFSSSYISYRNQLSIQRQSDGLVVPINSTVDGLCIGGGWRYENAFWEYSLSGCYSPATMNVDTDSSVTYQQTGVSSTTFMIGPSFMWKPKSGDVSVGIHIPIIYNTGDYTVPTGYDIADDTLLTYGYFLETNWKLSDWGLFTKFGKAAQFKSSLWMVGISLGL